MQKVDQLRGLRIAGFSWDESYGLMISSRKDNPNWEHNSTATVDHKERFSKVSFFKTKIQFHINQMSMEFIAWFVELVSSPWFPGRKTVSTLVAGSPFATSYWANQLLSWPGWYWKLIFVGNGCRHEEVNMQEKKTFFIFRTYIDWWRMVSASTYDIVLPRTCIYILKRIVLSSKCYIQNITCHQKHSWIMSRF